MKKWSTTSAGKADRTGWQTAGKASRPNSRLQARRSTCRIGTRKPWGPRRSIRILLQAARSGGHTAEHGSRTAPEAGRQGRSADVARLQQPVDQADDEHPDRCRDDDGTDDPLGCAEAAILIDLRDGLWRR